MLIIFIKLEQFEFKILTIIILVFRFGKFIFIIHSRWHIFILIIII